MGLSNKSTEETLIKYTIFLPNPDSHLFEVQMDIHGLKEEETDFHLATWTPGSYLIREYSRHIQELKAEDADNNVLNSFKIAKNIWRVKHTSDFIKLKYKVYANELTVRTSHLDNSHGFFNGATLFFFIKGHENEPIKLEINLSNNYGWKIATGLKCLDSSKNIYWAANWEELIDGPVEIGNHTSIKFEYQSKLYEIAVYGWGNYQANRIKDDIQKIVSTVNDIYSILPYELYTFIIHLSDNVYGGLEHRNSCTCLYDRFSFKPDKKYFDFLSLIAHEYFHAYLVKRIKPEAFFHYDYELETYSRHLWVMEGFTNYYEYYLLFRSGLITPEIYFEILAKRIKSLLTTPGRKKQSLLEASFDSWIKFYRPDENSINSTISYYLKGGLIAFALDFHLRIETNYVKTLDNILEHLYQHYAALNKGFSEDNFVDIVKEATNVDISDFYSKYIFGYEDPDFGKFLSFAGLNLVIEREKSSDKNEEDKGWFGADIKYDNELILVKQVPSDTPAYKAGIYANDEIIAIDNYRVMAKNFNERLALYQPETKVEFLINRSGRLIKVNVLLEKSPLTSYKIVPLDSPTVEQLAFYKNWSLSAHPSIDKKPQ